MVPMPDCASLARVCAAIPSYLEVRALERDCRRPVGMLVGTSSCASDAECASGLCYGVGSSICYAACEVGGPSCAVGTCTANAASMNLDNVLAGLGAATTNACVP